jgi:hypothetical protein
VLSLALTPDEQGFASVYTVQENGAVSVLVASQAAGPSEPLRVPGVALDDYTGREWLIVETHPEERSGAQLQEDAADLLPRPRPVADRWVMEITRELRP